MKVFVAFTLFLIVALIVGAFLSYPVYLLFDIEVAKTVTKLGKLFAILSLIYLLRALHLNNKEAAGYNIARLSFLSYYFRGLIIGIATLLILASMLLSLEIRTWDAQFELTVINIAETLLTGLIIGTLVGLLEETFFRGLMQTGIQRSSGTIAAISLTTLLYAGVHFIKSKGVDVPSDSLWSGLLVLQQIAGNIVRIENLDSFIALCFVGLVLSLVRHKNNHIAESIGIHAGWVMIIKTTKDATNSNPTTEYAHLVGSYDGIIGWLSCVYLGILSLLYYWFFLRTKT